MVCADLAQLVRCSKGIKVECFDGAPSAQESFGDLVKMQTLLQGDRVDSAFPGGSLRVSDVNALVCRLK